MIVFSTAVLFVAEACFAWLMVVGITACLWWLLRRLRGSVFCWRCGVLVGRSLVLPRVTDAALVRFAWFQIVFLAVWSVCFKAALYTSLLPWYSHDLMAKGQSLGIAIPAEVVALLLALVGLVAWLRSRVATGNRPQGGARDQAESDVRMDELVDWYRTFGPVALDEWDRRRGVE